MHGPETRLQDVKMRMTAADLSAAALTTIEIWRKRRLKPGPLSSNKFVTSYFCWSVFSEQTSGCRQSEIGRACCAEVAPGPKHTKIGNDDVERAQTTQ
jgi:hypothetical protein